MLNKIKSFRGALIALCLMLALALVFAGFARPCYASGEDGAASSDDAGDSVTDGGDDGMTLTSSDKGEDDADGEILTTGAEDTLTTGAEDEEEEKEGIKFVLFEKLAKLDTKEWIFFFAALAIAVILIIYLATRGKGKATAAREVSTTLILVHGALCIALSFVLSYIKLFSMPTGGSITLASMLPLMVYSNRHGAKWGLLAGLVYGILQYIQGGWVVHWLQLIFDYPLAFALIGLGGIVRGERNLVFSVLIGGFARFMSHFIGGVLFWGEYVMIGEGAEKAMTIGQMLPANIAVSFAYNAPYMFADIAICAIIALLPPFRKAIKTALKY